MPGVVLNNHGAAQMMNKNNIDLISAASFGLAVVGIASSLISA